jgi:serine/threonine protein phosphatase PrpC
MNSPVSIHWFSRKGLARERNSDACALINKDSYFFAIIADASEKGLRGSDYAMTWMTSVLNKISIEGVPSCEVIVTIMRDIQLQLRQNFPSARACWGALLIDHKNEKIWMFSCGDCRVGILGDEGKVIWITNVHSHANWTGEDFTVLHAEMPCRHQVTRSLNAKRFVDPDITEVEYVSEGRWILATDGYWVEHKFRGIPVCNLADDASYLSVYCTENRQFCIESDAENYFQI